jgi:hypothetical protein
MAIDDYRFTTRWLVPGTPREVAEVLENPADLARWWPSVYLVTEELEPADASGIGRKVALHTRGWLPYTLRWTLKITDSFGPCGFAFDATGDFEGRGEWTFVPAGAFVDVTFDWRITVRKPLLRTLSPLFRPALTANHRWSMRRGEESLKLELERRRAASEWERERIPPPPPPAASSGWILLAAGAAAVALGAAAGRAASCGRRRRRRFRWLP